MEENQSVKKSGGMAELYEMLDSVAISAVCVLVAFTLLFRVFTVSGNSMFPTLHNGDRLIVSGLMYEPKAGDIVCFYCDYKGEVLVKRVIATAGQTVDINENYRVVVDGEELSEEYLDGVDTRRMSTVLPYTVEPNHVFVMGDNRGDSMDSRDLRIGTICCDDILGRLIFRLFPRFGKVD